MLCVCAHCKQDIRCDPLAVPGGILVLARGKPETTSVCQPLGFSRWETINRQEIYASSVITQPSQEFRLPWFGPVSPTSQLRKRDSFKLLNQQNSPLQLLFTWRTSLAHVRELCICMLSHGLGLKLPKHFKKSCLKLFQFSGNSIEFQATMTFSITFLMIERTLSS